MCCLRRFWNDEAGQDLVEYALLLAFLSLTAIAITASTSISLQTLWSGIDNSLSNAVTAAS